MCTLHASSPVTHRRDLRSFEVQILNWSAFGPGPESYNQIHHTLSGQAKGTCLVVPPQPRQPAGGTHGRVLNPNVSGIRHEHTLEDAI